MVITYLLYSTFSFKLVARRVNKRKINDENNGKKCLFFSMDLEKKILCTHKSEKQLREGINGIKLCAFA